MTDARLDTALERAADDIAVCCGTPRDCLQCWCTPVAGWAEAVEALRLQSNFCTTLSTSNPATYSEQQEVCGRCIPCKRNQAIAAFCRAMQGERDA